MCNDISLCKIKKKKNLSCQTSSWGGGKGGKGKPLFHSVWLGHWSHAWPPFLLNFKVTANTASIHPGIFTTLYPEFPWKFPFLCIYLQSYLPNFIPYCIVFFSSHLPNIYIVVSNCQFLATISIEISNQVPPYQFSFKENGSMYWWVKKSWSWWSLRIPNQHSSLQAHQTVFQTQQPQSKSPAIVSASCGIWEFFRW